MQVNGTTYYYVTNLQGDVMGLADTSGNSVASYTYDPYGKVLTATGTLAEKNPLRYRGYYYDSESGLYYLQSRYYDPATRRFVNADSYAGTGQGLLGYNMFAYCGNRPVMRADSTGQKYSSTEIHNFVLEDICEKHPTMRRDRTFMMYKKPYKGHKYGFCDLYDTGTGEVWEAKRFGGGSTCTKRSASKQLQNYVNNGILMSNPAKELCTGGTHTHIDCNVFTKVDKDMEGTYVIGYWDAGDGIIFYDYVYIPSANEVATVATAILITAAAAAAILFSGGASPIPLPA